MKITVSVNIGAEKQHCWLCPYATNGGAFCQLFRVKLLQYTYPEGGDPPLRCSECLAAEQDNKQPFLFKKPNKERYET